MVDRPQNYLFRGERPTLQRNFLAFDKGYANEMSSVAEAEE